MTGYVCGHGEDYQLVCEQLLVDLNDDHKQCSASYLEPKQVRCTLCRVYNSALILDACHHIYNLPTDNLERIDNGRFVQRDWPTRLSLFSNAVSNVRTCQRHTA